MKKIYALFFILAFAFIARTVYAENGKEYRSYEKSALKTYRSGKEDIPLKPGMELRKIGGINLLIPEGAKVYGQNGQYFVETPEEFTARRIKELEGRLETMENKVTGLNEEMEALKSEIAAQAEGAEESETAEESKSVIETTEENAYDSRPEEKAQEREGQKEEKDASRISVY